MGAEPIEGKEAQKTARKAGNNPAERRRKTQSAAEMALAPDDEKHEQGAAHKQAAVI